MKLISDNVKCRKMGSKFEVYIQRSYLDSFGKLYQENKIWDSYATREACERASVEDEQSMINCGYRINERISNII